MHKARKGNSPLFRLRQLTGLTQYDLAERLGVDQSSVSRMEIDSANWRWLLRIKEYASFLGVSLDQLVTMYQADQRAKKKKASK